MMTLNFVFFSMTVLVMAGEKEDDFPQFPEPGQTTSTEQPALVPLECYMCSGNVTYCATTRTIVPCPAEPSKYSNETLAQFRCMLTFNWLDRKVYQGCSAKCSPDNTSNYERHCSAKPLSNCINNQCKLISSASSPSPILFAVLMMLFFAAFYS